MFQSRIARPLTAAPKPSGKQTLGRRWFCQTAMYYFQLFPSGRAIDLPRPLVVGVEPSYHSKRYGRIRVDNQTNHASRTFATQEATAPNQDSTAVISALEQLVARLDYAWEPNLAAPTSSQNNEDPAADATTTSTTATTLDPTTTTSPASSSSKSKGEYARIVCTGYDKLPPLQLGWIATHASTVSPSTSSSLLNNNWQCPRSAIIFFLAQKCGLPRNDSMDAVSTTTSPAWNSWIQDLIQDNNDTARRRRQQQLIQSPPVAVLQELRQAWTPPFEHIFQCLLEQNSKQTLPMLVQLRGDLLRLMTVLPKERGSSSVTNTNTNSMQLQPLEHHLRRLLSTWFSPGMLGMSNSPKRVQKNRMCISSTHSVRLSNRTTTSMSLLFLINYSTEIQRITFNTTSAGIIEKIAVKEAVHPMKSLDDLRRRLGPKRRVFALFHPLLPEEPLVILHVHLESNADNIPATMTHVLTEDDDESQPQPISSPRIATFYSISNTQPGLTRGLGLGEFLIKEAVQLLQKEFPSSLETFVTLSPLPGFRTWVKGLVDDPENGPSYAEWTEKLSENGALSPDLIQALSATARNQLYQLLQSTKSADTADDDSLHPSSMETQLEALKPLLVNLAAHYLVMAKNRRSGKPLDPVAGFHIHNGAEVHRINFAADLSRKGLLRSFGVMTNYRYRLDHVEKNKASFESSQYSQIATSDSVHELLGK